MRNLFLLCVLVQRPFRRWLAAALVASVAACGGGSDSSSPEAGANPDEAAPTTPASPTPPVVPTTTSLFGTATTGSPLKGGAVEVRCDGSTNVLSAIASDDGTWQIDTTGQTLPCAVRVSGAGWAYHSLATSYDRINISPLTDLMVARATGKLPAVWWGSAGPTELGALTQSALDDALAALRTALGLQGLEDLDPTTAVTQDRILDVLQAMQLALSQTGIDYAGLLSSAATGGFTWPESFRIALADAYTQVTGENIVVEGPGGSYTLVLEVTANGIVGMPITMENMPKPSSQEEFCGWVNDPSGSLSLDQYSNGGGTGTLTINSCSFNGTVGRISATMTITSPISMTVPYSVTYTYR